MALTATSAAAAMACLLLALAAATSEAATSPAPAPAVDCVAAAASLADCLDYVTPGSTKTRPGKTCCGEVKAAVANPALVDCLCQLTGSKNLSFPIDMKRVLALPGACGASNAAFSKCHIATGAPTKVSCYCSTFTIRRRASCKQRRQHRHQFPLQQVLRSQRPPLSLPPWWLRCLHTATFSEHFCLACYAV
ncbi:hypothetical protein PR202_gn00400 [Eleusine coracana subsp. coracana]|uniref:Bifunctional inhibitor/plant lipid transfer protein/seed storage helical domain-containing protein n=1 Tax=Eleusine coracana subsp. coracana TaxID=191504 RepID=A0AAV5G2Z8_ELECO|nr:hypothetical protein PR202_gn00400 [Eleusine coracana subsp. coracana]